jgi:hypothetical protein
MDFLECCRKIEECLECARRAPTRAERGQWSGLAATWIDCAMNDVRNGRQSAGACVQHHLDC